MYVVPKLWETLWHLVQKSTPLAFFGVIALLAGCRSPLVWSSESYSPDRKLVATARAFEQSGFGSGWATTKVYLNWTKGSQKPLLVLAFSDWPDNPDAMKVQMTWVTPRHLELSLQKQPLDFQAVKYSGVDISVRFVPDEPTPAKTSEMGAPPPPPFAYQKRAGAGGPRFVFRWGVCAHRASDGFHGRQLLVERCCSPTATKVAVQHSFRGDVSTLHPMRGSVLFCWLG
ncbi:MAG: hypothetical protein ACRD4R_07360 [Candidatus Acidiferrales bacterium]